MRVSDLDQVTSSLHTSPHIQVQQVHLSCHQRWIGISSDLKSQKSLKHIPSKVVLI